MSDNKPTVNEAVTELAKKLKGEFKVDNKTGETTVTDDVYMKHLPDGLTEQTVKNVGKYTTNFCAAATKVVGELAIEAMAANSKLEGVDAEIPVANRDKFKVHVDRRKEFPNTLAGKDADPIVKHAATTCGFSANAGKNSQLAAVRTELAELGQKRLK